MQFRFKIQDYQTEAARTDDSAVANFEELFRTYGPDTIRRVI